MKRAEIKCRDMTWTAMVCQFPICKPAIMLTEYAPGYVDNNEVVLGKLLDKDGDGKISESERSRALKDPSLLSNLSFGGLSCLAACRKSSLILSLFYFGRS